MKILFVQTNYPAFLYTFHQKIKNEEKLTYKEIKKLWANEFFGSSNFYIKNLRPLGWHGNEIIINDWTLQSKWMSEHGLSVKNIEIPGSKYIPARVKNFLGLSGWMKEIFFKQIKFLRPDILYLHDVTILGKSDFENVKKYTKLVVGQIAYPPPLNKDVFKKYDLIISSFPHFVRMFRSMGIKSEYLRWCVEGTLPKIIGARERIYDVSYVGGFSPHHTRGTKLLENATQKTKIDFWGYGENFLLPNSPIRKTFHGNAWGRDMYEIFAESKIIVNRHINISGKYANNMRMFDSTAMGALLITDQKSNMSEFFKVGQEVVTYNNSDDLVEKIKFYLNHPVERQKIAKAGQKRTLSDHTYKVRMKELNSILLKYLHEM